MTSMWRRRVPAGVAELQAPSPTWHPAAACRGTKPELFYPLRGEPTAPAKAVCATCPVIVDCLNYALSNHETFGIWGGTSERERRRLRRVASERVEVPLHVICVCCGENLRRARLGQRFCSVDCRTFHYTEVARGA